MARDMPVIWVGGKQEYFCDEGWTGKRRFARQASVTPPHAQHFYRGVRVGNHL
jgi:hypothetical protein